MPTDEEWRTIVAHLRRNQRRLTRTGRSIVIELRALHEEISRLGAHAASLGDSRLAASLADLARRQLAVRAILSGSLDRLLDDTQPFEVDQSADDSPSR